MMPFLPVNSFWVRKILSLAMTHVSLGTLQGATASAALVSRVSLVSTLLGGDQSRVSTPARHYFQHIYLLQIGISILSCMLSRAIMSSHAVGKCQTLTYIKACGYVGLSDCSSSQYQSNSFPLFAWYLEEQQFNSTTFARLSIFFIQLNHVYNMK